MGMSITEAMDHARAEVKKTMEEQKVKEKAAIEAAAGAEAAAEAARQAVARSKKLQCMVNLACLVAGADGQVSDGEKSKVVEGLQKFMGEAVDAEQLNTMIERANVKCAELGVAGVATETAEQFSDATTRRALLTCAAAGAWLDGGVGAKEGVALQGISKAFDIPIAEMHQILGAAKG